MIYKEQIRERNLHGVRFYDGKGNSAEAIRCDLNSWNTFYYVDGSQVCHNGLEPDCSKSDSFKRARKFLFGKERNQ